MLKFGISLVGCPSVMVRENSVGFATTGIEFVSSGGGYMANMVQGAAYSYVGGTAGWGNMP